MGLILVFDLDDTIAHMNPDGSIVINNNILEMFINIKQKALRGTAIDGIFLLTNNDSKNYVAHIDYYLLKRTGSIGGFVGGEEGYPSAEYFFDYIMDYRHSARNKLKNKSVADVKFMVDKLSIPYIDDTDILNRTFFFDDLEHDLKGDMEANGVPEHYIRITPPFKTDIDDKTDYKPVRDALSKEEKNLKGGKRSCYKKRRTLRRLRNTKRKRSKLLRI